MQQQRAEVLLIVLLSLIVQRDRELSAAATRKRHPWLMAWWRITRILRWTWRSPSYLIAQLGFRVSSHQQFCIGRAVYDHLHPALGLGHLPATS